jgi:predicted TPR repeat methyltransferase
MTKQSIEFLLQQAITAHQALDYSQAKRGYLKILQLEPEYAEAMHLLGVLLAQQGEVQSAMEWLAKAVNHQPNNAVYHNNLANSYAGLGWWDKAKFHYLQAIDLNPAYAEAYNNLGKLCYRQQQLQQAMVNYHKAVQLEPGYVEAHYNLGLVFLRQADLAAAEKQFRNVVSLNPNNILAREYLANICLQLDKLEQAEQHYESILQIQANNIDVLNNLAVIYLKRNQPQSAVKWFAEVLKIDAKHQNALSNIAATFLELERFEDAMTYYKRLLELKPDDIEAHYNLSVALMTLGQLEKAIEHLQLIIKLQPFHLAAHINLGAIYLKLRQRSLALHHYQAALNIQPDQATALYMISALTGQGVPDNAPRAYVKELFDNYAGFFDKHLTQELQYQTPKELYRQLKALLIVKDKWRVLDLGCGTGLCGSFFREHTAHLTGIDLSSKMLAVAKAKNFYDVLVEADINTYLAKQQLNWDLIIAADVLVYFGKLTTVFSLAYQALVPSGLFAFTTETTEQADYQLQDTGRYAHNKHYLTMLAQQANFKIRQLKTITARYQDGQPVNSCLCILEK